jgi:hypothetical protein
MKRRFLNEIAVFRSWYKDSYKKIRIVYLLVSYATYTMDSTLQNKLNRLTSLRDLHIPMARKIGDGDIYPLDLLALATCKRSMGVLSGACLLVENVNFMCAAPLLRLQLDNCLRFFASTLVDDPHEFAVKVMQGIRIDKQKSRKDKAMKRVNLRDAYLIDQISNLAPHMKAVYDAASGFVHLSEQHIFSIFRSPSDDSMPNTRRVAISDLDDQVTDEQWIELVDCLYSATELLLRFLNSWLLQKSKP